MCGYIGLVAAMPRSQTTIRLIRYGMDTLTHIQRRWVSLAHWATEFLIANSATLGIMRADAQSLIGDAPHTMVIKLI